MTRSAAVSRIRTPRQNLPNISQKHIFLLAWSNNNDEFLKGGVGEWIMINPVSYYPCASDTSKSDLTPGGKPYHRHQNIPRKVDSA
jgi:hypothetical protein